ncbi:MAG: penicillin-binding protein 2 [Leptolyngbyaceae cyanobacterium bins.59]|nr:penicillin-binding protein 2 [Leptolyngbyaceae cyanobacterium bins.59]
MASGLSFSSANRLVNATLTQRSHRSILLILLTTFLLSICGYRLFQLQILEGKKHAQEAEQNRVRLIPIASERGNITDRKGRLLASNRLSRSVYLWPRQQSREKWQQTALKLSSILQIPSQDILKKLEAVRYLSPMPIRITRDLTPTAFTALAEQANQLPGIEIRAEANRQYPQGNLAAHVLGYIGEATSDQLKANPTYPMGMIVGQMGIERIANSKLEGVWGSRLIETNARGKEQRVLGIDDPQPGSPVQLTLDLDVQKAAEKALANRRGAVVVLDVKTGAVLALASGPTFNPNIFTRRITKAEWAQLQGPERPFVNRALQGYAPGSTFKVVTSIAGMESGKMNPDSTLVSTPYLNLGGHLFWEHGGTAYGVIGFREALAFSSNTFFYQVGIIAGPEQISKWGQRLGIGPVTTLGLEGENHGALPTPAEKQKLYGEPWYGGDTVTMAIGQGVTQATPLELAVTYAAIANNGWRVKPHLMKSQTASLKPVSTGIKPETLAVVRSGLAEVVRSGTARRLSDGSIPMTAGKTGTAEVLGQRDNSLYAGYGPVNNPEIALAVVVENGGYGAEAAVPIAHEIYKAYFGKGKK